MTGPAKAAPLVAPGHVPRLYLDSNILLPEYLRAVFLDLADEELVQVHWGKGVLAEVKRNLLSPKFGKTPESTDKLLADMARAFPDALVLGSEKYESQFQGKTDRRTPMSPPARSSSARRSMAGRMLSWSPAT